VGLIYWTAGFVLASATISADSSANLGDYPDGSLQAGIKWDSSHYEEVELHLTNSSDNDFHDVDLTLASDLWVAGAGQLEPVCSGFQVFSNKHTEGRIGLTDSKSQNTTVRAGAVDLTEPSKVRVICGRFPRHSTFSIVVVVIAYNHPQNGRLPDTLFAPKRLPDWFSAEGDYRALGKTRRISIYKDFRRVAHP
jgi:hypothetical protein